jgi:hypothetical protein
MFLAISLVVVSVMMIRILKKLGGRSEATYKNRVLRITMLIFALSYSLKAV